MVTLSWSSTGSRTCVVGVLAEGTRSMTTTCDHRVEHVHSTTQHTYPHRRTKNMEIIQTSPNIRIINGICEAEKRKLVETALASGVLSNSYEFVPWNRRGRDRERIRSQSCMPKGKKISPLIWVQPVLVCSTGKILACNIQICVDCLCAETCVSRTHWARVCVCVFWQMAKHLELNHLFWFRLNTVYCVHTHTHRVQILLETSIGEVQYSAPAWQFADFEKVHSSASEIGILPSFQFTLSLSLCILLLPFVSPSCCRVFKLFFHEFQCKFV